MPRRKKKVVAPEQLSLFPEEPIVVTEEELGPICLMWVEYMSQFDQPKDCSEEADSDDTE